MNTYFQKAIILGFFFCFSMNASAQVTEVVALNGAVDAIQIGNNLIICKRGGTVAITSKIVTIDYTVTNPAITEIVSSGLSTAGKIALYGDELYVIQNYPSRISKIDIFAANPTIVDVVTDIDVTTLEIIGNELYFAESCFTCGYGKLSKIDLTATNPTVIELFNDLAYPTSLQRVGNELYIGDWGFGNITKFDFTETNPTITEVLSVFGQPAAMEIVGNDLYISLNGGDSSLIKIDITEQIPTPTNVLTGLDNLTQPYSLEHIGDYLYFATGNNISKLNLSALSVDEYTSSNKMRFIYPNPSKNYIKISGLNQNVDYKIYNILGAKILEGIISENEEINIENLMTGLYFLEFEKGKTIKFIKE